MIKFVLEVVGIAIEVVCHYPFTKELCKDYIVTERKEIAFSVFVSESEIKKELEKAEYSKSREICECTCIQHKVREGLLKYGVILMHAAVIAVDGKAYLFMAKSGVGKSTHIRRWKEHFGDRAVIVNGDKPWLAFKENQLWVYGSPWRGKEYWGENISMPVAGICLLERGENNEIRRATHREILEQIFYQVVVPNLQFAPAAGR